MIENAITITGNGGAGLMMAYAANWHTEPVDNLSYPGLWNEG